MVDKILRMVVLCLDRNCQLILEQTPLDGQSRTESQGLMERRSKQGIVDQDFWV